MGKNPKLTKMDKKCKHAMNWQKMQKMTEN